MPVDPEKIRVDVVYAEPSRAIEKTYSVPLPATVADVLLRAAADPDFRGVDMAGAVGVFGKPVSAQEPLRDLDRVEIYRPLAADPKTARRARVRRARVTSSTSGRS